MPAKVPHKIMVGTTGVGVYLSDVYDSIGATVGVSKVSDTDLPAINASVTDLVRRGSVARIRIGYESTAGRRKYANIVCDLEKVKTAISALAGKTYKTGTIKSAFFGQRRRLG